jgi:hypothetical protein
MSHQADIKFEASDVDPNKLVLIIKIADVELPPMSMTQEAAAALMIRFATAYITLFGDILPGMMSEAIKQDLAKHRNSVSVDLGDKFPPPYQD